MSSARILCNNCDGHDGTERVKLTCVSESTQIIGTSWLCATCRQALDVALQGYGFQTRSQPAGQGFGSAPQAPEPSEESTPEDETPEA